MSMLKPFYAAVSTLFQDRIAFLIVGLDASGRVWALEDFDKSTKGTDQTTISDVEASELLIEWLTKVQKNHGEKIGTKGKEIYAQPNYVTCDSETFAKHYYYEENQDNYLKITQATEKITDFQKGINRIQTLIDGDNLQVESCGTLKDEMELASKGDYEEGELLVHRCLIMGVNTLANSGYWRAVGKSRGGGKSKDTFSDPPLEE